MTVSPDNNERSVTSVVQSLKTLEGGGFDGRHPWRPSLRGALRASNLHPRLRRRHIHVPLLAPGEIVQVTGRTLRVLAF